MSLRSFEAAVLQELRLVARDKRILQRDITEWSSGPIALRDGEKVYHLPGSGVNVAVKKATP